MTNVDVRINYRPVRIGWCIRENNWEDLRSVLRLTHLLWGGRFNPIIPVEAGCAKSIVRRFRVDILADVADDVSVRQFSSSFTNLPWPVPVQGLFSDSTRLTPNFLDVSHVLEEIEQEVPEQNFVFQHSERLKIVLWEGEDPLADVFLATFGAYPPEFEQEVIRRINPASDFLREEELVPSSLLKDPTPSAISEYGLSWYQYPLDITSGFYVGEANNFQDVVNFWNLRASCLDMVFLDPTHSERLRLLRETHLQSMPSRREDEIDSGLGPVWSRSQELVQKLALPASPVPSYHAVTDYDALSNYPPAVF